MLSKLATKQTATREPMEYLHTMIRVTDLKATIAFFELMGFVETRRIDNEKGRYTLVFLAAPGDAEQAKKDQAPLVELTYNWDPEVYTGGRNFGHLAYRVDDIYATCAKLKAAGVTINRPPRDGHMAFIRTPDYDLDRAHPEGRLAAAGRALGVDAEHRRVVRRAACSQAIAALTRLRNSTRKYARFSGVWTMRMANSESRGRHPERRAHHAAPEELADAARGRRSSRVGAHREAEAEAVTGPEQKCPSVDPGVEMIARHEGERSRREDAHAVERAADAQHGGEARIVGERRHEPAAAGFEFRRRRRVAPCRRARRGHDVERERIGAPASFVRRREEGGVDHAERAEQPLLQDLAEARALDDLDHASRARRSIRRTPRPRPADA